MENTKNKNTPPSPNMFLVFFVFKNIKQFLKTTTKQALSHFLLSFLSNNWRNVEYFKNFCIVHKCTVPLERISQENYISYLSSQTKFCFQKQLRTVF